MSIYICVSVMTLIFGCIGVRKDYIFYVLSVFIQVSLATN